MALAYRTLGSQDGYSGGSATTSSFTSVAGTLLICTTDRNQGYPAPVPTSAHGTWIPYIAGTNDTYDEASLHYCLTTGGTGGVTVDWPNAGNGRIVITEVSGNVDLSSEAATFPQFKRVGLYGALPQTLTFDNAFQNASNSVFFFGSKGGDSVVDTAGFTLITDTALHSRHYYDGNVSVVDFTQNSLTQIHTIVEIGVIPPAAGVDLDPAFSLPKLTFASSITATLPQPTISAAFSLPKLTFASNITATLPQPTITASFSLPKLTFVASIDVSTTAPVINATFTLPKLNFVSSITNTLPQPNINAAFQLPKLTFLSSIANTLPQPVINSAFSLPKLTFSSSITATLPQPTASIAFSLPKLEFIASVSVSGVAIVIDPMTNIDQEYLSNDIQQTYLSNNIDQI